MFAKAGHLATLTDQDTGLIIVLDGYAGTGTNPTNGEAVGEDEHSRVTLGWERTLEEEEREKGLIT